MFMLIFILTYSLYPNSVQPVLMYMYIYMYAFSMIEYQKESEKQNNHVLRTGAHSRALSQK